MNFIYPNFLWGLLGLAVPLAIHLWSKRKVPVIKIGSIQFLTEPDSRQSSSIQLNEWWLLALRMLAIVFLCLILAGPHIRISAENSPVTYLVEPSLLDSEAMKAVLDTLPEGSVRLLGPGFPDLEFHTPTETISPNYWHLAKAMSTLHTDSIVVFTRALLSGLKGMRPAIGTPIQWVIINPDTLVRRVVDAQSTGTGIRLLSVVSDDRRLSFDREEYPTGSDRFRITSSGDSVLVYAEADNTRVPLIPAKQVDVHIFYSDSLADQKEYLLAALRAVARYGKQKVNIDISKDTDTLEHSGADYIIWLSNIAVPEFKANTLVYQPTENSKTPILQDSSGNFYYLTKHLDAENITAAHLTGKLVQFLSHHSGLDNKLQVWDRRSVSLEELATSTDLRQPPGNYAASLDMVPWFLIILGLTLVLERIVAKIRRQ